MEGVLIVKELFSRSGHLHSFGEGYHKWIFLIFGVSALHTACMFSGCVCDVCDTAVHAHRLLRHEQEHTHTHTHTHTHKAGLLLSLLTVSSSSSVKLKLLLPRSTFLMPCSGTFLRQTYYSTNT